MLGLKDVHDAPQAPCIPAGVPGRRSSSWCTLAVVPRSSRRSSSPRRTIRNWVARADANGGKRPDLLTSSEREELVKLRRELRKVKLEREILAKATAWFAREADTMPKKSSGS